MAKKTNVKEVLKAINKKMEDVVEVIREEIDSFRPVLVKDINRVIKRHKDLLDIEKAGGPELIKELGVGQGGEFALAKIRNAWEALQVDYPNSGPAVTTLQFSKDKRKLGSTKILVDIYERYFNLNITKVQNKEDDIPWMKWFIQGAETPNYKVQTIDAAEAAAVSKATGTTNRRADQFRKHSRTGEALMIPSKGGVFWKIEPRPNIFPTIEKEIQLQVIKSTQKFLKIIRKRFKK